MPSNRGISIFSGDDGIVENVKISNIECKTHIHAGGWWGKGEGFIICAANAKGQIKNVTLENCHFTQENPSIIAGTDGNVDGVKLVNCTFEYKEGYTHPFFKNKMDLQPNIPQLQPAPFKTGDLLYTFGCENVTVE